MAVAATRQHRGARVPVVSIGQALARAGHEALVHSQGPYGELVLLNAQVELADNRAEPANVAAIQARWECGRWLLARREGRSQLPDGVLDEAAAACGVSRIEMTRRMTLADLYPTEDALNHGVIKFPSWHQMAARGLRTGRTRRPTPPARKALTRLTSAANAVHKLAPGDVSPEERRALIATLEGLLGLFASYDADTTVGGA